MYDNFENLQKRCKQYRLKKRVKFLVPVILIIGLFLYLSENSLHKKKPPYKPVVTMKTKEIKKVKIIKRTKIKEQIIEDIPYALQIDKKYLPKQLAPYRVEPSYKEEVVPKALQKIMSNKPPKVYIKREEQKALVITVKKLDTVEDMIAYYNKEKKYSLALKITQTYYNAGNYLESLHWSKKANLLNRDADGAWILYAKSEYALGNHKKAIKILNLYISNTDSKDAKTLLLTWTQGK